MRLTVKLGTIWHLALCAVAFFLAEPQVLAAGNSWQADVTRQAVPANTENNATYSSINTSGCIHHQVSQLPFSVSVDGIPTTGAGLGVNADSQRCTDLALDRAEVQIRYDDLNVEPRLNVVATTDTALRGSGAKFIVSANYDSDIDHAEVRIFADNDTVRQRPIAVLPVAAGEAHWPASSDHFNRVTYVARVYDASGRYDETKPQILTSAGLHGGKSELSAIGSAYDGNSLEIHNIPVSGGAITVSGVHLTPGSHVHVMGAPVPVDRSGAFAYQTILSPGIHQVRVEIADVHGHVSQFTRTANIPDRDWFYVALADLTVGHGSSSDNFALLNPDKTDEFANRTIVHGRLAFYLKGKIRGGTLLTASADTKDQPIGNLFTNFTSKDPHYLLRRLNPDKYYPVYGDDSSAIEDAPTQGKFYLRLERGDSHILWGNFNTAISGTDFVRYNRGLYGAETHFATEAVTRYGEKRGEVEVFAAQPGTLGARDVFRGTGGSLYYLRRQNITPGSERVSVEVRDEATGVVLQSKVLRSAEDFDLNTIQGRVVLREPLASTANDSFIVHAGSLSGSAQYLVVTYEFTPGLDQSADKVVGGRSTYWLNDNVQLGASGYDQTEPGVEQKLAGVDMTMRYAPGTYLKLEGAQSDGPGTGESLSTDGGFGFGSRTSRGELAKARRVEAAGDLAEIAPGHIGHLGAYWQEKGAGFSGPGNLTGEIGAREMGASADIKFSDPWSAKVKVARAQNTSRDYASAESDISYSFDDRWVVGMGVKVDGNKAIAPSASPILNDDGRRTDLGLKLGYDSKKDWSAFAYVQKSVERTGSRELNDRVGAGGALRLTTRLTANGELSIGSGGLGGRIGTQYQFNNASTAYLTYVLDPDRSDVYGHGGEGALVSGVRTRFSDSTSVFGEERYTHGAGHGGLTQAFGLDFVPIRDWNASLAFETGSLSDPNIGDTKRTAASLSAGYAHDGLNYTGKLEFRKDQTTSTAAQTNRNTWLVNNSLDVKVSRDWRFLGKFNGSWSDSTGGDFYDGNYVEAVTGFAFRPALDDRLNALFKYTYYYDLPSVGQLTANGSTNDFAQLSHVLSIDADYDLLPWLTVGGKYAFRYGTLRSRSDSEATWFDSKTSLAIARLDVHLNKRWDVIGEIRLLDNLAAKDRKSGALVGIYRHVNENVMIGGGYNFTDFSDDLTNLSYKSQGAFINVVGKF